MFDTFGSRQKLSISFYLVFSVSFYVVLFFFLFLCSFIYSSGFWLEVGLGCTVTSREMLILQSHVPGGPQRRQAFADKQIFDSHHKVVAQNLCWKYSKAMEFWNAPPSPKQQEHRPWNAYDNGTWVFTKVLIESVVKYQIVDGQK